MNWAHPERMYLLVLLPVILVFLWTMVGANHRALTRFGNPELLERAGMAVATGRRVLKALFILIAVAFLIIALAGPQWGATREKIERKGVDVVVVLDTSMSMLAQDVAPSRIAKAKAAIEKLIDLVQGDRIGIVAFAGAAFTMCPVTLDYDAARMFLDIIDTTTIPEPGTDIPEALYEAAQNFEKSEHKHKAIILISDGENLETKDDKDPVGVAEELSEQGIVIFTVGVGGAKGSSIPIETPDGVRDKMDSKDNVVITKLDENTLRKIALAANGKYRRLDNRSSGDELAEIYSGVAGMDKKQFEEEYQVHYEDRFQWFLAIALVCLVLEAVIPDRRRKR